MSADTAGFFHARSLEASLTVRDLATSLPWYTNVLGFTPWGRRVFR